MGGEPRKLTDVAIDCALHVGTLANYAAICRQRFMLSEPIPLPTEPGNIPNPPKPNWIERMGI